MTAAADSGRHTHVHARTYRQHFCRSLRVRKMKCMFCNTCDHLSVRHVDELSENVVKLVQRSTESRSGSRETDTKIQPRNRDWSVLMVSLSGQTILACVTYKRGSICKHCVMNDCTSLLKHAVFGDSPHAETLQPVNINFCLFSNVGEIIDCTRNG